MYKIICRAGGFLIYRSSRLFLNSTDQKNFSKESSQNINNSFPSNKKMASAADKSSTPKFTNRLVQEKSPYLLQHAHNPVDWYPWSDEAIQRAKEENKLIFLSVGYSTCHWCHVMERESFENEEIAKIMNENFINIKVDREERPDIDKIYMHFLLMINGHGGWPMSIWLTPDLGPITGGSYFPPTDRWGTRGFKTVLETISNEWNSDHRELISTGNWVIQTMEKTLLNIRENSSEHDIITPESKLNQAIKIFKRNFDESHGGFGSHPKFYQVPKLNFLIHAYMIKNDRSIIKMILSTLTKIGNGGVHDHVFGGFARYSVDGNWHVPHFEKMLYDQGQLLAVYANVYKITSDRFFLDIADRIFRYIMKDLRHPNGGFYSGEDADSFPSANSIEKVEGAFYVWTYSEIQNEFEKNSSKFSNVDAKKAFDIYCYHYNVQSNGNVEPSSDPHGHFNNKNILFVRKDLEDTAEKFKMSVDELKELLITANAILYEVREKRSRPHLDTKIITSWNGLVLTGLAKLSNCCTENREEYLKASKELVYFLRKYLFDEEKKILLRSCYGEGTNSSLAEVSLEPIAGFLDDYAFLIKGLLDYYKATLDLEALEWAKELQDIQDKLFWDPNNGGYFYSNENTPNMILRPKEDHDGVEPCGNSVAVRNLILLSAYFEEPDYKAKAKELIRYFDNAFHLERIGEFGYILPEMLSGQLLIDRGLEMTAVVGPDCDKTKEFLDICRRYYIPGMIVVHFNVNNPSVVKRKTSEKFKMIDNEPTVYICHNRACQLPITDPLKLEEIFKSKYIFSDD